MRPLHNRWGDREGYLTDGRACFDWHEYLVIADGPEEPGGAWSCSNQRMHLETLEGAYILRDGSAVKFTPESMLPPVSLNTHGLRVSTA